MNYIFFKSRFKITLIKVLAFSALYAGKLIFSLQNTKKISILGLEKIIINRSDRMGDAMITYLWIETLILYLQTHGYKGALVVLSSPINHWILAPLEKYPNTTIKVIEKDLTTYVTNPLEHFLNWLKSALTTVRASNGRKKRQNRACIDLISDPATLVSLLKDDPNLMLFGPNLALSSGLIDNGISEFYTIRPRSIIESYNLLLQSIFTEGNDIIKQIDHTYSSQLMSLGNEEHRSGITLFIWVKSYRNFTPEFWENIILVVSQSFSNQKITVMDDPDGLIIRTLQDRVFPENVVLITESDTLANRIKFMDTQKCVVGIDGGGMNILRTRAPSITLYTTWTGPVWTVYSSWEIMEESLGNGWYLHYHKGYGHRAQSIIKKSFFIPSYEIELEKSFFENFDISKLVHSIHLLT